jgi:hypothetical protein
MSINKPFPKETYERWAQMYIEGSTARSIAEKYGVSSYTVIYHLEKLGVKRRSNSESHMYDSNKLTKPLSHEEKQVIVGSIIGDGWTRKQYSGAILNICHAENQLEWLKYKAGLLSEIAAPAGICKRKQIKGRQVAFEFRTLPHVFIRELHDLSYGDNGKRIITDIIPMIDDLALAVLWGDDGCYGKNGEHEYGILSTCAYSFDDNKLLSQHLKEKYGITSSVLTKRVRDKIYPQIRISKQGMSILKEVVKPYLPPSMLYKIGG